MPCHRFLGGFAFDTCLQGFYLLGISTANFFDKVIQSTKPKCIPAAIEYVPMNRRAIIGNLALAVGFTFAGIYEPWLLRWLGDWKTLQYVVYGQVLVVLGTPWWGRRLLLFNMFNCCSNCPLHVGNHL